MDTKDLEELASQLRHPNGEKGIAVANMMNETNIGMTYSSINSLKIQNGHKVLELGHGNCGHLSYLLKHNITYYGLEMSVLMNKEAQHINAAFVSNGQATFSLYDGNVIPFSENYFDRAFTVNTIYFWKDTLAMLMEIYRVLKPSGIFSLTFAEESFMQNLPFTKFGFELYSREKAEVFIKQTPFTIRETIIEKENVKNKIGELIEREYVSIILIK